MKDAKLDINESTLVFEYPGLYYLDLNLKYLVNSQEGKAKFDRTKKTLNIRLPVVGSTADSQKVLDRDYAEYMQKEKERQDYLKRLEISKIEEELLAKDKERRMPGKENENPNDESELRAANEGTEGISSSKFIQAADGSDKDQIADIYSPNDRK